MIEFCIVAGQDPIVKSEILFSTDNLDEAIEKFHSISDTQCKHAYLLANYGMYTQSVISKIILGSDTIPFIVLEEYNSYYRKDKFVSRSDTICIYTEGIVEEFSNNIEASKKILLLWHKNIDFVVTIRYKYGFEHYEVIIADSKLMRNIYAYENTDNYRLREVIIDNYKLSSIEPNPSILSRRFTKEEYIKRFTNKE